MLKYYEFIFRSNHDKWFAFTNLGRPGELFNESPDLDFARALGTGGGNGFSIIPSLKKYSFLIFSKQYQDPKSFIDPPVIKEYKTRSKSYLEVSGLLVKSHGKWNGENPFLTTEIEIENEDPIAVITRATIRPSKLMDFWLHVPKTSKFMYGHPAAIFQSGIGEYPLFMQATFSIWKSKKELYEAAYSDTVHAEIVKKTRQRRWYKEELFAEFKPIDIQIYGSEYESLSTFSHSLQNSG